MTHYFFNIRNDDFTEDFEGKVLMDDQAARAYAVSAARDLASQTVALGHLGLGHRVEILNEAREAVGMVKFGEAVELRD